MYLKQMYRRRLININLEKDDKMSSNRYADIGAIPVNNAGNDYYDIGAIPVSQYDNSVLNNDEAVNPTRSPMEALRDVAGAFAGTLQRTAAGMGEVGQYIGDNPATRAINKRLPESVKTKYFDPNVNVREELGLGQDRPVDLQKIIQSQNPDPGASMVGGLLPAVAVGGASIPGQIVSQTAFDTLQASPDQENLGGLLPQGKVGQAIKSAAVNTAVIGGIGMGLPKLIDVLKPVNGDRLIESLQKAHDVSEKYIKSEYNDIGRQLANKNVRRIPLDFNTKQLIDDSLQYFPNDPEIINIARKAKSGDYPAISKWQTMMRQRAKKFSSVKNNVAENDKGTLLFNNREKLIDNMKSSLDNLGHNDIANRWQAIRDFTRNHHETYFPEGRPSIANMFKENLREIPSDPLATLTKKNIPTYRLVNSHPEVNEAVARWQTQQHLLNIAKISGLTTGIGGGIYGINLGYKVLRNMVNS